MPDAQPPQKRNPFSERVNTSNLPGQTSTNDMSLMPAMRTHDVSSSQNVSNTAVSMNFCNVRPDIISGMFAGAHFSNSTINVNFSNK